MQRPNRPGKLQIGIIAVVLFIFLFTILLLIFNQRADDVFIAPIEEPKNVQELISQSDATTGETNTKSTEPFGEAIADKSENIATTQAAIGDNVSAPYFVQKTENLSFCLLRAYMTKQLPYQDPDKVIFWNEAHTPDGTLTAHTYIFIDVTIQNLDNTPREIYLNSCNELYIESNVMMPIEMRYRKDGGDANSKSYFRDYLQAGEEKTYMLGYIIEDENADKSLTLRHNPLGRLYDDSIRQYEIFPEKVL